MGFLASLKAKLGLILRKIGVILGHYLEDTWSGFRDTSGRQWIKLIGDDLIKFAVVFLLVMAFQIHVDSAEYQAQCQYLFDTHRYDSNPFIVSVTNTSPPMLHFEPKNSTILQQGMDYFSVCTTGCR